MSAPTLEEVRSAMGLDGPDAVERFASLIESNRHLHQIIFAIDPEQRRAAYEALKPYLVRRGLKPKPFLLMTKKPAGMPKRMYR